MFSPAGWQSMKSKTLIILGAGFLSVTFFAGRAFAQSHGGSSDLMGGMVLLVFQLAVMIFAARLGGSLFEKFNQPQVLGELVIGIIIGPFLLGAVPLPGFPQGLFPLREGFPLSPELYGFATVASIVLLFLIGLETNIEKFFAFSGAGTAVGIGGALVSFVLGAGAASLCSTLIFGKKMGFADPGPLFLGVVSAATSAGITARLLSEKRKVDSPEGATIIMAAIIDDVITIVLLALVLGHIKSGRFEWMSSTFLAIKALGIWLLFTVLGLVFSRQLSTLLKKAGDRNIIALMSFALALFLAGVFEKSGLAMIVGAYVVGFSLSGADISFVLRRNLAILYRFFVPLFFCAMGMLVNIKIMASTPVLIFGLVYLVSAFLGKLAGCGLPALLMGFNLRGAARIGVGMVPRGEVALLMAGIGLALGIIPSPAFAVAVIMTLTNTILPSIWFNRMIESPGEVMRKYPESRSRQAQIVYAMPNPDTAELVMNKVLSAFYQEGFYVQRWGEAKFYQIRKDKTFISLLYSPQELIFDCQEKDAAFVHTLFYEVLAEMERIMKNLQGLADPAKIGRKIFVPSDAAAPARVRISQIIRPAAVKVDLQGNTKMEIIEELLDLLVSSGQLKPEVRPAALRDLLEREDYMSTGMQNGIALPHAKSTAADRLICAFGLKKDGVDFNSLDGKAAEIFLITLSPKESQEPYLQFMAEMSQFLRPAENRQRLLASRNDADLYQALL